MTDTTEVKPCPFCGGDANEDPESQHMPDCYFDVLARLKAAPKSDLSLAPALVRAWNRRAQPASVTDAVRKDAERYRWLKSCDLDPAENLVCDVDEEKWDAYIDAAMAAKEE